MHYCRAKSRPSRQGPTWHNRTDAVHIHYNEYPGMSDLPPQVSPELV
jgi:hypothetical protein